MLTPAGCAPATLSRVITSSSNTNTITAVLLAFLLILASTNATPLGHGQNGLFLAPRAQSASTGTEADTSSRKKSGPPVAAIAVPIVVVLTLVLVLIFWSLHRKTKVQLPNRRASTQSAANNTSTAPTTPAATPAAQDGSQTRPGFFGGFWQWYHGPRGGFSRTGTQSTTDLRTSSTNASPQANSGATDAAAGSTPAQTNSGTTRRVGVHGPPPRSSRRNRNRTDGRPRRTDSGASVRTVPAYKSEVGDDEMVLFKSIEESGLTTVLSRASVEVAESEAGPQAGSVEIRTGARRSSQRGSRVIREGSETPLTLYSTEGSHEEDGVVSPLLDEQGFAAQQGQADPAAQEEGRADRSGSRRSRMSNLRHSLRRSMHINAPQNGDDNEMEELHSEGSELPTIPAEDAPSYELAIGTVASMPVAATSTENVATQEPSHETSTMSETSSPTNRRRAALRSIFMRHGPSPSVPSVSTPPQPALATPPRHQRCGSSGSVMTTCTSESGPRLSLSQTQSRPSFVGRARAFYASEAGASSMSLASSMLTTSGSPNATLGGRQISAPLRDTLVRSNYEYPRRGLTPEQLSFLSSVDSLGRFGVPVNGAENSPDPARSPTPREDLPPPPFPEAEEAAAAADNPGDGFVEADLSAPAASVEEAVIAQPVVPQAAEAAEAAEDLPTTENTASNTSDAEPSSASSASADGAGARQSISVSTTDIAPAPVVEVQPSTPVSGSAQD